MAGVERSRQGADALFHHVAHSRLIGIAWPESGRAILSDKDLAGNTLAQAEVYEQIQAEVAG